VRHVSGWPGLRALGALLLLVAGCGTFEAQGRLQGPAEATDTALVRTGPTPKLAFIRGGDLWTLDLATRQERRLTSGETYRQPRWSASGRWVAFFKEDRSLWSIPAEGGQPKPVTTGPVKAFGWSPAADLLVYVTSDGTVRVARADGAGARLLAAPPGGPGRPGQGAENVAWSPDGKWLAFDWAEGNPAAGEGYQGIRLVPGEGGEPAEVYRPGESATARLLGWSPDGAWLALWIFPYGSASLAADGVPLGVVPAACGRPVMLEPRVLAYADFVAWRPDGKEIAVISGVPGKAG